MKVAVLYPFHVWFWSKIKEGEINKEMDTYLKMQSYRQTDNEAVSNKHYCKHEIQSETKDKDLKPLTFLFCSQNEHNTNKRDSNRNFLINHIQHKN